MQRLTLEPRPDWRSRLAALGMEIETQAASPYWHEDAAYVFDETEVEAIHDCVGELEQMVMVAVDEVIRRGDVGRLAVPDELVATVEASWRIREPSLYGRYDLRVDGATSPKLLEYNADTPTALFEASIVQWHWLEELFPDDDQYNSIHEELIEAWRAWLRSTGVQSVHHACVSDDDDDLLTTVYLLDVALQAGLQATFIELDRVGWNGRRFVDLEERPIEALFKLYPWEFLAEEPFLPHLRACLVDRRIRLIEPAWRLVASSKGLLAVLWELFPGHPNLLQASLEPDGVEGPRIVKPMLGREGSNTALEPGDGTVRLTDGPFEGMPTVTQAFDPLPSFDGWHPVVGAWVAGGEPCGIGIREQRHLITGRGARFVPHVLRGR